MPYTQTEWNVGDVITEAKLDQMEQGIDDAHAGLLDTGAISGDTLDFPVTQQTADYTLALSDANSRILAGSGSADITITIPPASTTDFPSGSFVDLVENATGFAVTIAEGSGVTLTHPGGATGNIGLPSKGVYRIINVGGDNWMLVPASSGYIFVERVYITATGAGTFTKADYPYLRGMEIHAVGGGGGGGDGPDPSGGGDAMGGGGGAGAYTYVFLDETGVQNLEASASYSVGAGGASSTAGSDTTFDIANLTQITANGGGAGQDGTVNTTTPRTDGTAGTGGSADTTNADYSLRGEDGGYGRIFAAADGIGGRGGNARGPFGGPGGGEVDLAGGEQGGDYGGGGSGAHSSSAIGFSESGGSGRQGVIVLDLYA